MVMLSGFVFDPCGIVLYFPRTPALIIRRRRVEIFRLELCHRALEGVSYESVGGKSTFEKIRFLRCVGGINVFIRIGFVQ